MDVFAGMADRRASWRDGKYSQPGLTLVHAGGYTLRMHPPAPDAPTPTVPQPVRERSPHRWILALIGLWVASLVLAGWAAARWASPDMAALRRTIAGLQAQLKQVPALQQQVANLKNSDTISRAANQELQTSLSERDEEVAALRADVAFYERLVGAGSQRRGLAVNSVKLDPNANGSWHYAATLTQNLNRGKITQGGLTLQIDGAHAGKLQTLQWADLLQKSDAPAQAFAFRYFQKVEGNLMLPAGFTPHKVTVLLKSDGGAVTQAFSWADARDANADAPAGGKAP